MSELDDKALVAQILSSYLSNNTVAAEDLPAVIDSVRRAFRVDSTTTMPANTEAEQPKRSPAVPVKKSIAPEELTCLCCGGKFKTLKRHLKSHHLTPESYRSAFDLKNDYPLVAPNYSAVRVELAKSMGLGRKTREKSPNKKVNFRGRPAKKLV